MNNNQKQSRKFTNWEDLLRENNCFSCQKGFTEKDIQEKNYRIVYADWYGSKEIYNISHQKSECKYNYLVNDCDICQQPIINLMALNNVEKRYHPECLEREKYYCFHIHPKILKVDIHPEYKITVFLNDGREITKSFELFKKLGCQEKELEQFEIVNDHEYIYFPKVEQRIFVANFSGDCGCC